MAASVTAAEDVQAGGVRVAELRRREDAVAAAIAGPAAATTASVARVNGDADDGVRSTAAASARAMSS